MTLANYADLIAEVPIYIDNRTDLTSRIPNWVALAEAKMNRKLRVRRMVTRLTISPSAETLAVPADFGGVLSMRLSVGTQKQLEPVSVERYADLRADTSTTGGPSAFVIEGGNFAFWPTPSASTDIILDYYATVPSLQTNSTNWMMTYHPDAYLHGVVAEGWSYLGDNEEAAKFAQLFTLEMEEIAFSSVRDRAPDRLTPQLRNSIV